MKQLSSWLKPEGHDLLNEVAPYNGDLAAGHKSNRDCRIDVSTCSTRRSKVVRSSFCTQMSIHVVVPCIKNRWVGQKREQAQLGTSALRKACLAQGLAEAAS